MTADTHTTFVAPGAPLRLQRIETFALEAPIERPVRNSWRTLTTRSALIVRVTAADGAQGWGEVWCNYPPRAAQHRAHLVKLVAAPLLIDREFEAPEHVFRFLEQALRIPSIQSGESGPFAQVAAGIDNAVWDLAARRAGQPLWKYLGGVPTVEVYASGLSPDEPEALAAQAVRNGFRAAKLKVGMESALDRRNAAAVRAELGDGGKLMFDANQRWTPDEARSAIRELAEFNPEWFEEPIPADEPLSVWETLARASPVPLAAGENLRGRAAFDDYISSAVVHFLQPDMGKWGGFTECLPLGRRAISAGIRFCPHWLGGAVGLLSSLHLLGAAGGIGWGEFDANPNPLRERLWPSDLVVNDGRITLGHAPGIGSEPDPRVLKEFSMKN